MRPPVEQTVVLVGGGTGFGAALAIELARRGAAVLIAGRTVEHLQDVVRRAGPGRITSSVCDVTKPHDIDRLWQEALDRFGRIDHWVNNSGISHDRKDLSDLDAEDIRRVVETNLIGALTGARRAMRGMLEQGHGHVWITEGLGSNGPVAAGTSLYSATKAGVTRAFATLVKEARGTPIRIGFLRPGIMLTPLALRQSGGELTAADQRIMNLIGDYPETVAPAFARGMLTRPRNGTRFTWLTIARIVGRLLRAPFAGRQIV